MMTSEERAQNTFRSLATEAINLIYDALDMLGDFAPLHKNEMYGPEVDEAFTAIEDYVALTKAKYEPDKKRVRFAFKSEKDKQASFGMNTIAERTERTEHNKRDRRKIGLWDSDEFIGAFDSLKEVAGLIGCTHKNVDYGIKSGRTIMSKYTVRRLDPDEVKALELETIANIGQTQEVAV